MKWDLSDKALNSEFRHAVEALSGQNLSDCCQCGKCSGGCPATADDDMSPTRVLRMVQLGLEDEVLRSNTIWCCAACGTCTSRCPMGVDIVRIMDVLRSLAQQRGISPWQSGAKVWTFYEAFLDAVEEFGRLSEVALMGGYNINSGRLWTNVIKAPWFLLKNKLTLLPHRIQRIDRLRRVFKRVEEIERG